MFEKIMDITRELGDKYLFTTESKTMTGIVTVLTVLAMWMIFTKAKRSGWRSLVPLLNVYTLVDIADTTGWKFLLLLIPVVGVVYYVLLCLRLARVFRKGTLFAVGLMLFPTVFMLILGFGKAKYKKRKR